MPEFVFEGNAVWKSETESDLTVKGTNIVTVSPPVEFGEENQGTVYPKRFSLPP